MRITRRSGKYRQLHNVENANRSSRDRVPITVSYANDNSDSMAVPRDGRLKVSTERDFSPNVPFEFMETDNTHKYVQNPVNQMGALLEDQIPVVTVNDFESFMAAFNKRSNFVQAGKMDDISDDVFHEALDVISQLPDHDGHWPEWEDNFCDRQRWLDKFDIHKQKRMIAGLDAAIGMSSKELGRKDLSVKLEVLLKRDDPEWAPRIIYAGNDAFNAVTGPAMMVVMERLVELLARTKVGPVKFKLAYKTNDVSIVEFLDDFSTPHTYEGDFSANDKEQRSRTSLIFDAWLEKLAMPQWLRDLLIAFDVYSVGNHSFGVLAHLKYQLPTGTTATTPRNSIYNMTMFAVACARQRIPFARACVLGDDILARTCRKFCIVLWKAVVDLFKMRLKGKDVQFIGQATLLSRRIIIAGDTKCMVPLLGKAIARFNARASLNSAVTDSRYMAGKSLSYAYEFRHVPFMRDFFLSRYEMEDTLAVTLDDLTWFTRTAGIDLGNIVQAIMDETVLVPDHLFAEWLMDTYELGMCDLEEIMTLVIVNQEREFITHPSVDDLAIDW